MSQEKLDPFTCRRCGYQASRPEFIHGSEGTFAYCPSCRFYGPTASDVITASRLFTKGGFDCEVRCQDCGLDYPWTYVRWDIAYGTSMRIQSCARCFANVGQWVPQPQDSLPDKAYEKFLANGTRYLEGYNEGYQKGRTSFYVRRNYGFYGHFGRR